MTGDYDDEFRDRVLDAILSGCRSVDAVSLQLQVFSTVLSDCLHDLASERVIGWGSDFGVRAIDGQSAFPSFHVRARLEEHRVRRAREQKEARALAREAEERRAAKGAVAK